MEPTVSLVELVGLIIVVGTAGFTIVKVARLWTSRPQSPSADVTARLEAHPLVTIARDGRLLDVGISKSSGYKTLDNAVLEVIRSAAPYAPLPNDMLGDRHSFLLPLNYRRNDQ